jgi:hypothetical protein
MLKDQEFVLSDQLEKSELETDDFEVLIGEMPPSLVKALDDPFDYMLGLRDGRIIHFYEASLCNNQKWVTLIGQDDVDGDIEMTGVELGFPRGIDVRISDIMWCADAPGGS